MFSYVKLVKQTYVFDTFSWSHDYIFVHLHRLLVVAHCITIQTEGKVYSLYTMSPYPKFEARHERRIGTSFSPIQT